MLDSTITPSATMEVAKATLLEPVMHAEITVPDEFAGSIMGDLNSRRGRIQGMDNKAGNTADSSSALRASSE